MQVKSKAIRAAARLRKRLLVRMGYTPSLGGLGFTVNVSPAGLAVSTRATPRIGATVFFEFSFDDRESCRAEGVVVWARRGLGQANDLGIRFTRADDGYMELLSTGLEPGQAVLSGV